MLKKQDGDLLEASLVSQEMDDLQGLVLSGKIPKDVKNLKRHYELLAKNFKQKQLALADAEKDYNDDKFDLIDQIRDQRQSVTFLTKLIKSNLSNEDVDKLRYKSKWVDSDQSFKLPGFLTTGKKITFPKIPKYELQATWQQIKETRYIQFTNEDFFEDVKSNDNKENYGYSMAQIVESNAEADENYSIKEFDKKKIQSSHRENKKVLGFPPHPISDKNNFAFSDEQLSLGKSTIGKSLFESAKFDSEVFDKDLREERRVRGVRLKPLEDHSRCSTSMNIPSQESNKLIKVEKHSSSMENKGRKPPGGKQSKLALQL